jgi:hypothetical protein
LYFDHSIDFNHFSLMLLPPLCVHSTPFFDNEGDWNSLEHEQGYHRED